MNSTKQLKKFLDRPNIHVSIKDRENIRKRVLSSNYVKTGKYKKKIQETVI